MPYLFFASGLFLGWSLGANDAANIFGAAVGTRMLKFKTAALISSVFVVLGAVISGGGASETLGKLGGISAIGGAFTVAGAAGFTVFWMSKLRLPVSTSQAIVGAILGWNFFSGTPTDTDTLSQIILTWALCPLLAGIFAIGLFIVFKAFFDRTQIHLLSLDQYTRSGLIVVGAFGAYSLGANNIANVMGVFVPVSPFRDWDIWWIAFTGTQQLFLLGGLAIAVGIYTYSERVMRTVGRNLMKLSPESALVVVLANALVLFVFSSQSLSLWLTKIGLPAIPLVPVSSTQAIVGAVLGIGVYKRARGLNYGVLGEIALGWVTTPVVAGLIALLALFVLQNVFQLKVL